MLCIRFNICVFVIYVVHLLCTFPNVTFVEIPTVFIAMFGMSCLVYYSCPHDEVLSEINQYQRVPMKTVIVSQHAIMRSGKSRERGTTQVFHVKTNFSWMFVEWGSGISQQANMWLHSILAHRGKSVQKTKASEKRPWRLTRGRRE